MRMFSVAMLHLWSQLADSSAKETMLGSNWVGLYVANPTWPLVGGRVGVVDLLSSFCCWVHKWLWFSGGGTFQLWFISSKMTKSQIPLVWWCRELGGVLTYFSNFLPKFKNDKIPNSLCLLRGLLTYFLTFVPEFKNDKNPKFVTTVLLILCKTFQKKNNNTNPGALPFQVL